jgi:hypothetical protein
MSEQLATAHCLGVCMTDCKDATEACAKTCNARCQDGGL